MTESLVHYTLSVTKDGSLYFTGSMEEFDTRLAAKGEADRLRKNGFEVQIIKHTEIVEAIDG